LDQTSFFFCIPSPSLKSWLAASKSLSLSRLQGPDSKMADQRIRAPPAEPTAVPWAPWVNEVDALPEWKLSGKTTFPSEFAMRLDEEGLKDFVSDHPNNPSTLRQYERSSDEGGPVIVALHFDKRAEGASGCVHEGAIAACADSLVVFHNHVNGVDGPTMKLTVCFCKPMQLETCMRADCYETLHTGTEYHSKGSIVDGNDQSMVYAEFEAEFFVHTQDELNSLAQLTPDDVMSRGLALKFPLLSLESEANLMDTDLVKEFVGKNFTECTEAFKENGKYRYLLGHGRGQVGSGFVTASRRMKSAYFMGPDRFVGVFSATVECMGPLECVHGGCIFTWHAESVIACMRLRAPTFGVMASRGALKRMSVEYLQLAPLKYTYAIHVSILEHEHDARTNCWKFALKTEMATPATGVVHSIATAEFECGNDESWELLDHEFIRPRWVGVPVLQNLASAPVLLGSVQEPPQKTLQEAKKTAAAIRKDRESEFNPFP